MLGRLELERKGLLGLNAWLPAGLNAIVKPLSAGPDTPAKSLFLRSLSYLSLSPLLRYERSLLSVGPGPNSLASLRGFCTSVLGRP